MRVLKQLITGVMLASGLSAAQAAIVDFTLIGDVITGDFDGLTFGLNPGDTITVTGSFDDSVLTGGTGTVVFDLAASNTFSIDFGGGLVYGVATDSNQVSSITLDNGSLVSFDYFAFAGRNGAPYSFDASDQVLDPSLTVFSDRALLIGQWRDIEISAVPVPAALWLFGSGLLGLAGIARRK